MSFKRTIAGVTVEATAGCDVITIEMESDMQSVGILTKDARKVALALLEATRWLFAAQAGGIDENGRLLLQFLPEPEPDEAAVKAAQLYRQIFEADEVNAKVDVMIDTLHKPMGEVRPPAPVGSEKAACTMTAAEILAHTREFDCASTRCKICLALDLIERCSWCDGRGKEHNTNDDCPHCDDGMEFYIDATPRTLSREELAELMTELNQQEEDRKCR